MRALVELALASGQGPVSVALIAKQQRLSVAYLEQLLHRLKKQGLVVSIRGPKGGYCLAKDADQITIGEIVHVLDGVSGVPPFVQARPAEVRAQRITQAVFHCVHERLAHALDEVTLQELCDEARDGAEESLDHRYVFHI